ncbi:hypothetical protein GGR57DRAFT_158684 [Xylariaceae sp. FL1272]|nr:hypothetical protein GGR57DRAFT_158684 [Xylariaceae sp. FL1272]
MSYYNYGYDASGYRRRDASNRSDGEPMARGLSEASASSAYSDQSVSTPGSTVNYDPYNNVMSPMSPLTDYSYQYDPNVAYDASMSDYTTHGASMSDYTTSHTIQNSTSASYGDMSWLGYYRFITDVEQGQDPYWKLSPEFSPNDELPPTRPAEDMTPRSHKNPGLFYCLHQGCSSQFKRHADLERHAEHRHKPVEEKTKFHCDRKRCARSKDPFHRRDHCRDHYRDYHKEDLMRRSSVVKENASWWSERDINPKWWRCARCLQRVDIDKHGFNCSKCNSHCEQDRQNWRSQYYR